jgi:hypothetical protein
MDQRRKIARKMVIKSISGVGRPAQAPALATIMKSRETKENGMAETRVTETCPYCGHRFETPTDQASVPATAKSAGDVAQVRKARADAAYGRLRAMAEAERARIGDYRPFAVESAFSRICKTEAGRALLHEYNRNSRDD